MYRFLLVFLMLSTMQWSISTYEDFYDGFTEITRDRQIHPENGRYPEGQRSNTHSVRHTHTDTRVDVPHRENLHNGQTTVKNYIMSNTKRYINASDNHTQLNKSNKLKSQAYEEEARMIYPSDMENFTLSTRVHQIRSRNCSFGLCDEVDNYPVDKIQRILSRSELKKYFTSDVSTIVENRFGDGENLCATITHTRFPKTAKNMQNKEQVIVNVDQYKQGIIFETCKEEGPCNFAENFPNNYTPTCVQKYTVRKLMVVGKESDDTVFDDFKIPSCCVCVVKK